jgi:hypothetical protein
VIFVDEKAACGLDRIVSLQIDLLGEAFYQFLLGLVEALSYGIYVMAEWDGVEEQSAIVSHQVDLQCLQLQLQIFMQFFCVLCHLLLRRSVFRLGNGPVWKGGDKGCLGGLPILYLHTLQPHV